MKITQRAVVLLLFTALFTSRLSAKETTLSGLQRKQFQTEVNGNYVDLFTLTNKWNGSMHYQLWWKSGIDYGTG